ncbi:MAG TPA: TIGR03621 family F420-dependent LLM class oxidoreductase [Pseudonocardiaceae bacterium]|jgi:probable F420-dependent oxidoreductase
MTTRPFRFGVSLLASTTRSDWHASIREAESLGYDVIQVPDHIGLPAPFPALMAAVDATPNMTLGTYVLNGGILNPTYLARDVADMYRLSDHRFELGLGAGYVPAEFEAVGVPFGTGGDRLRKLESLLAETRALLAALPDKPIPPIMLSGAGPKMLRLAGREADIFSFAIGSGMTEGLAPEDALVHRVQILRDAAGERDVELNLFVAAAGPSPEELDLTIIRNASGLPDELILQQPGVLAGPPSQVAERLQRFREELGISYVSVLFPHMRYFAEVIKHLR